MARELKVSDFEVGDEVIETWGDETSEPPKGAIGHVQLIDARWVHVQFATYPYRHACSPGELMRIDFPNSPDRESVERWLTS